jgi:hypothetical protein
MTSDNSGFPAKFITPFRERRLQFPRMVGAVEVATQRFHNPAAPRNAESEVLRRLGFFRRMTRVFKDITGNLVFLTRFVGCGNARAEEYLRHGVTELAFSGFHEHSLS